MVTIVTKLLVIVVAIQVYFWYYYFIRLVRQQSKATFKVTESLNILFCAYNESHNLRIHVPLIASQKSIDFDILIIDDQSEDDTALVISELAQKFTQVRYIKNTGTKGKKGALIEGLKQANADWLLLTDADCEVGNQWANAMLSCRKSENTDIILGYSPLKSGKSLVSKWAHFEAWITALLYLSFAKAGIPYMGVGRNILYRRKTISEQAVSKYDHLVSGDDDLTVMQLANKDNTEICLDPNSFVYTKAPDNLASYINQKHRHYSTATSYKLSHKILLSLYAGSQILFYFLILLLIMNDAFVLALMFYTWRMVVIWPVAYKLRKKLHSEMNTLQFMIMDFIQSLYYIFFSLAIVFPKRSSWD